MLHYSIGGKTAQEVFNCCVQKFKLGHKSLNYEPCLNKNFNEIFVIFFSEFIRLCAVEFGGKVSTVSSRICQTTVFFSFFFLSKPSKVCSKRAWHFTGTRLVSLLLWFAQFQVKYLAPCKSQSEEIESTGVSCLQFRHIHLWKCVTYAEKHKGQWRAASQNFGKLEVYISEE